MTNSKQNDESGGEVPEFSKEALDGFLAGLRANQNEMMANAANHSSSEPTGFEAKQLEEAAKILAAAVQMDEQGGEADTPLAHLLRNPIPTSIVLSIAMSPMHSDFEKARLIAAAVIVSLKEYNVII